MGLGRREDTAGRRRALLIGVKETPYLTDNRELDDDYPALDFVDHDLELLGTALEQSDYEVFVECDDTSVSPVIAAVSNFLAACEENDTAFLYFSCHGVTVEGRDYLVMRDSQPGVPRPDGTRGLLRRTLLRADPAALLGELPELPQGVTVIICLDICRAEQPRAVSDETDGSWSGREEIYWLYSCGPGQRAYADPVSGSWFAQALAAALSRANPPTTFVEVADHAEEGLRQLASAHPHVAPPSVGIRRPEPVQGGAHRDPIVCDGTEQTLDWTRVIRDSGLWRHTSGRAEVHEQVKERLTELVRWVVNSGEQTRAYRNDPWADPLYPKRLDARLTDLVARAELTHEEELLSPAETACLLSAAIVQEGIVAITLHQLSLLLPGQFDPGPRGREKQDPDDRKRLMRDAARDVCRAHSLVVRTTETLRSRRLDQAVTAADHWLRHRFIAEWDGLWERDSGYQDVDALITKVVEAVEAAADTPVPVRRSADERLEIDSLIRQVLGHLTVKPGLSPRVNDRGHGDEWVDAKPVRGNHWRGQQLARLLWTAGLLAASPRRLSSVLVDHLGAHVPLRAADVVGALGSLDYDDAKGRTADTRGLAVRLRCPRPALHAAVEELALTADATVRAFGADAAAQPMLRGLPDRVTTDELRAVPGRYKEPLERFRLAEDEIRPLLMGTQLYGDRMLALRELYQNALDACRYREMRRRYGKNRSSWDGEIVFTQGWHGDRPYIECLDNGSGMSRARLTSMFARAGKRYEQDPEFVQERRNWRRANLVDKSLNSRFGIGVFSYFMLADEVVVWTQAVDATGRVGSEPPLRVDIRSGSGLLQINTADDPELVPVEGGTRVRLYLAEPQEGEQVPSLVETLRTHLWVTEHHVRAEELIPPFRKLTWDPGVLGERTEWRVPPVALHDEEAEDTAEMWLVEGPGQLLLDGVLVTQAPAAYGYVVNLRERHTPVPSVDRNQLLSYDAELVMQELLERVPEAASRLTEVSLPWLWQLSMRTPRLSVRLLECLPRTAMAVLDVEHTRQLVQDNALLDAVGCLPTDTSSVFGYENMAAFVGRENEEQLFTRWRASKVGLRQGRPLFIPAGYPPPAGLDAVVFRSPKLEGWQTVLHAAAQARRPVREVLRHLRRYAVTGFEIPEAADIKALDDRYVTQEEADLHSAYAACKDMADWATGTALPAPHAPLLAISALHSLTLGEAAALLRHLLPLDPGLPTMPSLPDEVARQRLTKDEAHRLALSTNSGLESPWNSDNQEWRPGVVGRVDLLSRSAPPVALPDLAQRIEQFACLGYALSAPPSPEAVAAETLSSKQRLLLSQGFDRQAPWHEGALLLEDLFEIAQMAGGSLGEVSAQINATTPVTGVHVPQPPPEVADVTAPPWFYTLFKAHSKKGEAVRFTPWELVGAYLTAPTDIDEFRTAVQALDACELLDWRGADMSALERQVNAPLQRLLRPLPYVNRVAAGRFDQEGVTIAYLMALAAHFGMELGAVADELRRLDLPLDLDVPVIPEEFWPLTLSEADFHCLSATRQVYYGMRYQSTALKDRLSTEDLVRFAHRRGRDGFRTLGKAFHHLSPLCAVAGIELPGDFRGPDADRLADLEPDEFDLAAFDGGLLGPGSLGALELVLVAGRFDWTLAKAYDRYAPFACLGLTVTTDGPRGTEREIVPDWADVIILTTRLTGRAPALSGEVPAEHITLCAEETELEEAQVYDRLNRYARLFDFTLPERPERKVSTS